MPPRDGRAMGQELQSRLGLPPQVTGADELPFDGGVLSGNSVHGPDGNIDPGSLEDAIRCAQRQAGGSGPWCEAVRQHSEAALQLATAYEAELCRMAKAYAVVLPLPRATPRREPGRLRPNQTRPAKTPKAKARKKPQKGSKPSVADDVDYSDQQIWALALETTDPAAYHRIFVARTHELTESLRQRYAAQFDAALSAHRNDTASVEALLDRRAYRRAGLDGVSQEQRDVERSNQKAISVCYRELRERYQFEEVWIGATAGS
jgi:hypothetical protein